MLQFPYLEEPLTGPAPHSLPATSQYRYRPLIPVTIVGPRRRWHTDRAVVDTGSDDTVFPLDVLLLPGAIPLPDRGHRIRWAGQRHSIRYAQTRLILADDASTYSWPAIVAFSPAPLPYPLLGVASCLQYFDARFLGADHTVELEANWTYPGTK